MLESVISSYLCSNKRRAYGISYGIQSHGAGDRGRDVPHHRAVPSARGQGRVLLRRALLVGVPCNGDRVGRRVGRRAAYPVVYPAGRVGRFVALVDRRAVRTARACRQGLVSGQSRPEGKIGLSGEVCRRAPYCI